MSDASIIRRPTLLQVRIGRIAALSYSFALSATVAIVLIIRVAAVESFNPVRLGAVLVVLLAMHLLRYPRVVMYRELVLYLVFVAYMFLSLLWAPDLIVATNTLVPALNFVLILLLFGALATYHNFRAVLAGTLAGFLIGAVGYTVVVGFPFVYPEGFSYNAVAGMYLFGLFITLLCGWLMRSRILSVPLALILLILITATTSIKTNLGVALGTLSALLLYFRNFIRVLRRHAVAFAVVAGVLVYAAASNDAVVERVQSGLDRVALGVEILSSREDVPSGTSFEQREYWMHEGLREWVTNPIFGYGVEAFRVHYGITSHSTPVDLLYNTGVIGLALFYAMFISIAWRLFHLRDRRLDSLRALLVAFLVCYLFITISGTMLYNDFLAVFVAVSVALLRQAGNQLQAEISPTAANP